jgi:predicted nucleotidyltransferase component of viral defense system
MTDLDKIRQTAQKDKISTALVFKEHVQLVILEYLFRKGLFSKLVFQGGTALRLAYQGVRYSEDLDFVLKRKDEDAFKNFKEQFHPLASHVKKLVPIINGARLKVQKETDTFQRYCLVIEADFLNAKDKTNIEIVNVPSHEHHTVMIRHPDLALVPAVAVETTREILSDKIVAFAARPYVKGRDLWDIFFIMKTLNVAVDPQVLSMVKSKIKDYQLHRQDFPGLLAEKAGHLQKDGARILHEEMDRFLPASYRGIYSAQYPDICRFEQRVFREVAEGLEK